MQGKIIGAILAAVLASASLAEDEMVPIRAFDIKTIEALGQHMYRQDQEAWKATDLLPAKYAAKDLEGAARGWIVDETPGRDVVRFLRAGANGIEAAYDVTFVPGAAPSLSEPQNRILSPEETAQAEARHLAASSFTFRCSNDPANTVAFRDPTGDGWLVWVMSATHDTNAMMLGGHMRFTISPDGKTVVHKDALSKSCNILSRKGPNGEVPAGYFFTHIVSDTPVETHVFASLSYGANLVVGTPDRTIWMIEKGSITKVK
jgi:hypothetical protein